MKNAEIGQQVVRSKGDYVVGRIGTIVAIDDAKKRAQVQWNGETKTWVSFGSLEPTSIPYEIVRPEKGWARYIPKEKAQEQFKTEKVMYNGQEVEAINFGKL